MQKFPFNKGNHPEKDRPIQVLETIRQGYIGGGESHLLSLVSHLDQTRYKPFVLSFTGGPMIKSLDQLQVPVRVIPSGKAFDLRIAGRVKSLLRAEKIDLVHAHGSRAAANIIWAARSLRIPVIYTIHGWSFHDDQPFWSKWLRIRSEAYLTSRTAVNISVSVSNQDTGRKNIPGFRSVVIPNGVDLEKFNTSRNFQDIRGEIGIPAENILVTSIFRITKQKDPLNLIRGFSLASQQHPELSLLIVGEGELKVAAINLVSDLGLEKRVFFQGFRQDVPDILQFTDIYCLPSLWEGMPIGLLEAMAMGKAAIATSVDGSREIIRHGENGWLIEPGNPGQLSEAILYLDRNSAVRTKLGMEARNLVNKEYSVQAMTLQVEKLYRQVMAGEKIYP